jgi:hypothetical protein
MENTEEAVGFVNILPRKYAVLIVSIAAFALFFSAGFFLLFLNKGKSEQKDTNFPTSYINPVSTNASQQESAEDFSPSPYDIEGIFGLDGSAIQSEAFNNNKCKIVNRVTSKTVSECMPCYRSDDVPTENKICIKLYTNLQEGPSSSKGQYFFARGAEGGGVWTDVYFIDFDTEKVSIIESLTSSADPELQDAYELALNKYSDLPYQVLNLSLTREGFCEFPDGFNPGCMLFFDINNKEECKPMEEINENTASSCIRGWKDLTEDIKQKILANIESRK